MFILAQPADSPGIGLGHPWQEGGQRIPAAAVADPVRPAGRVDLLPTPNAALGRGTGFPSEETAQARYDRGARCLDDAVALLPTPRTNDGRGTGAHGDGGIDLRTAVALLPTPRARDHKGRDPNPRGVDLNEALALLPTPRATDGTNGGPNQRGTSGDLMLPSAVMLLPTPTATPYGNNQSPSAGAAVRPSLDGIVRDLLPTPTAIHWARNATAERADVKPTTNDNGWTLSDVAHAARWGQYAPAIGRWERVIGRPAPAPTEPGKNGQPRLAARFVEWMLGLPDGWVTGVPGLTRNQMLRLLGNGVVPRQAAPAVAHLARLVDEMGERTGAA